MPITTLAEAINHVRAKNRPGQIDGILLAEIDRMNDHIRILNLVLDGANNSSVADRLRAENAELRALCGAAFHKVGNLTDARDHLMAMRAVDAGAMPLLTEAQVDAYLAGETTDV